MSDSFCRRRRPPTHTSAWWLRTKPSYIRTCRSLLYTSGLWKDNIENVQQDYALFLFEVGGPALVSWLVNISYINFVCNTFRLIGRPGNYLYVVGNYRMEEVGLYLSLFIQLLQAFGICSRKMHRNTGVFSYRSF